MKYRIGAVYQTLPWFDQQIQLTNKALTFGLGIPIINQLVNGYLEKLDFHK